VLLPTVDLQTWLKRFVAGSRDRSPGRLSARNTSSARGSRSTPVFRLEKVETIRHIAVVVAELLAVIRAVACHLCHCERAPDKVEPDALRRHPQPVDSP
jgi:hypothetical protein